MPILADIKYQVELSLKKQQPKRKITPKEKVMFLTRVLYEKKTLKQACAELSMPFPCGQAIWLEHTSQYNKNKKKLYQHSPSHSQKTAGIKILPQGKSIQKPVHIRVLVHGTPQN